MAEKITRQVSRSLQNKGRRAVTKLAESLKTLSVEYVPIADIHPNEYNPNRQSPREYELLLRSMEEDGFTQPILVQRGTQRIVDGEHRWRAAHDLEHVAGAGRVCGDDAGADAGGDVAAQSGARQRRHAVRGRGVP